VQGKIWRRQKKVVDVLMSWRKSDRSLTTQ
jgi:hypothetical protein